MAISFALLAAGPTTTSSDDLRFFRGRQLRAVLLQLLEQSCRDDGVWPATLPPLAANSEIVYIPPSKPPTTDPDVAFRLTTATVVLHESLDRYPGGVWVGYADGHLEFAIDSSALADCQSQLSIERAVSTIRNDYMAYAESKEGRACLLKKPTGQITLRILDPQGRPISGALIGSFGTFGDANPEHPPHAFFFRGKSPDTKIAKIVSGADGSVTVAADNFALSSLSRHPSVPVYVLDEPHGLAAIVEVTRDEFAAGASCEVRLKPACTVTGHLTSLGLEPAMRIIHWSAVEPLFVAGHFCVNSIGCESKSPGFNLILPPGDYELPIRTDETNSAGRYLHISPDRRQVNLQLDLEPIGFDLPFNPDTDIRVLIGRPAPELRSIQAWKNTAPVTLASLRGHVILVDFWGYWCGNCVTSMPDLMKLYDEFHDQGLDVLAVHDNSVATIQEMDQKLVPIRAKLWAGRDLPFPVAIDGGQAPAVKDEDHPFHGDTAAAYHVNDFATTLVIGRDGNVLGEIDVRNPDTRVRVIEFLKSPASRAK